MIRRIRIFPILFGNLNHHPEEHGLHQDAFLGGGFQAFFCTEQEDHFFIIPIGLPILNPDPDPTTLTFYFQTIHLY